MFFVRKFFGPLLELSQLFHYFIIKTFLRLSQQKLLSCDAMRMCIKGVKEIRASVKIGISDLYGLKNFLSLRTRFQVFW